MENLVRLSPFVKFKEPDYVFVAQQLASDVPNDLCCAGDEHDVHGGADDGYSRGALRPPSQVPPPGKLKETNAGSQTKVISLRPGL